MVLTSSAIVTGGSAGIGLAISKRLAGLGYHIVMVARNTERGEKAADDIRSMGFKADFLVADVALWSTPAKVMNYIEAKGLTPTVLINNAAGKHRTDLFEESQETWDTEFNTGLRAAFTFSQEFLKLLAATKESGTIINVGSVAATLASSTKSPAYHAAKAGLVGLTTYLAVFGPLKGARVTVNCVEAGLVILERDRIRFESDSNIDYRTLLQSITPVGSIPRDEDIASTIAFLCSDEARHISGACLRMDGAASLREQTTLMLDSRNYNAANR